MEKDKENYAKLIELGSNIKNEQNRLEEKNQQSCSKNEQHQSYTKSGNGYQNGGSNLSSGVSNTTGTQNNIHNNSIIVEQSSNIPQPQNSQKADAKGGNFMNYIKKKIEEKENEAVDRQYKPTSKNTNSITTQRNTKDMNYDYANISQ